jgi:hypothetical protein
VRLIARLLVGQLKGYGTADRKGADSIAGSLAPMMGSQSIMAASPTE